MAVRPEGTLGEPWQDWLLLVLSPVLACAAGLAASYAYVRAYGGGTFENTAAFYAATGFITNTHFVLAFWRSHGNRDIFRRTPWRFTLAPALLFAAMLKWELAFCAAVFANVWWDTWHSSAQTFGLCRIYDAKLGNDPEAGRGLDLVLNWFIFTGPVLAFAIREQNIANSVAAFGDRYPELATALAYTLRRVLEPAGRAVGPAGAAFAAYYAWRYARLAREGYRFSPLKLALLFSTFAAALVSWGFNGWGAAIVSMNLFHSVQYFAIVWLAERGNIRRRFGPAGGWALPVYLASGLGYAALFLTALGTKLWLLKLSIAVATLHFWYDGFVWSVRREQLPEVLAPATATEPKSLAGALQRGSGGV